MPCYSPLQGWKSRRLTPRGKRSIVFTAQEGFADLPAEVPCGQCIGCRLELRRQWAVRCVNEASLHEDNAFITLTYDDAHLPKNGSVCKRDVQLFLKKLRRRYPDDRIRYFAVGEYGERTWRPHYHVLLFGFDLPDKRFHTTRGANPVYHSASLEQIWTAGLSEVGSLTYQSAGYVSQYAVKKYKGKNAEEYYGALAPEFALMSRRPGIGSEYYERYKKELLQNDSVIMDGHEVGLPAYYSKKLEAEFPEQYKKLKAKRRAKVSREETRGSRLLVKNEVATEKAKFFSHGSV